MARMAFAIRPPRPITFPTSASATARCSFTMSPSTVSVTTTSSGLSTSCLATCVSRSDMRDMRVLVADRGRDLFVAEAALYEQVARGRRWTRALAEPVLRVLGLDDESVVLGRIVVTDVLDE